MLAPDSKEWPLPTPINWSIRLDAFVQSGQGRHSSDALHSRGGICRLDKGRNRSLGHRAGQTFPSPTLLLLDIDF